MLSSDKSNMFVSMKVQLASWEVNSSGSKVNLSSSKVDLSGSKVNLSKILILKSIVCGMCVMFSSDVSWGMNDDEDKINRQNMIKDELDRMSKEFKVVLLGDEQVGKTQIISIISKKSFNSTYNPTVLNSPSVFMGKNDEKNIKLAIWDTPGQKQFNSAVDLMCTEAHAVVLVYDITNKESFENIQTWINIAQGHANKDALYFLVGNKADLNDKRKVSKEEAEKYAEEKNMQFFEVSAKDGTKIKELFNAIAKACAENAIKGVMDSVNNKINNKNPTDSKEPEKNDIQTPTPSKNKRCNCCPCCNKDEEE